MTDTTSAQTTLTVGSTDYEIHRIDAIPGTSDLPFSLKILVENVLRNEDGVNITAEQAHAIAAWDPHATPSEEIQFTPARVLMQDFTGVPCIVDLAAMREAMVALGGDPTKINPLRPAELVIDHSVIADVFGESDAFARNVELEYQRNGERYQFLRWGQSAFDNFRVVPPGTGIVHQVNLEYLARVVVSDGGAAYCDTVVGTDSHTTMINGLGVLGWGVGGIEAEAAMLGQPVSMLVPSVVGVRLSGELAPGVTATDLVLTITERLRQVGVVGKFVEFFGPGVANVPLANRATIGNMSPEYGSTCAIFPIDDETLTYLRLTGRPAQQIALVEAYAKEQGLWHNPNATPRFSQIVDVDLTDVVPSLAGPRRPQDRVALPDAPAKLADALAERGATGAVADVHLTSGQDVTLTDGDVVIAAITSCTNTSNPSVMIGAALLARNAVQAGLSRKPWVKTTLAPGSQVVRDYYDRAGLTQYLDALGFNLVGYGCTTCIGNSGPLLPEVSAAVNDKHLSVAAVLSGNRNFEGRINPDVQLNYLASPPLVVAYALAGSMRVNLATDPLGYRPDGTPVLLADIWPSAEEVDAVVASAIGADMYAADYADVFRGDETWRSLPIPTGDTFTWESTSTYVRRPPYFDAMGAQPAPTADISGARVLVMLGNSVTTDHISPAGSIRRDSPAGRYLIEHGVAPADFNSYGSRRGNHEVMIRGTFANIRLRNQLVPGVEGGVTRYLPTGEQMSIFDAAQRYRTDGTPLVVLAGTEYGSGSSRDWAAKGTSLLGVRAVIAESYERIHRSNLIGMGVLPLQFSPGQSAASLGLTGEETFTIAGIAGSGPVPETVTVTAGDVTFTALVRIDTPGEAAYFRHGGILPYVLRSLASA